ncbi:MAG TPA: flagellar biosynthesis protein FliQ [Stellaceae bacterium]|nr:flagellar biosynthesis protein FliQ [Stellaceae bacterium]
MNAADAMSIAREAIFVTLKLGAPAMILGLIVGLLISFLQALTQIQEMTLTFVPKMLVILLSLLLFLPFMLQTLISFTQGLMERVVSG